MQQFIFMKMQRKEAKINQRIESFKVKRKSITDRRTSFSISILLHFLQQYSFERGFYSGLKLHLWEWLPLCWSTIKFEIKSWNLLSLAGNKFFPAEANRRRSFLQIWPIKCDKMLILQNMTQLWPGTMELLPGSRQGCGQQGDKWESVGSDFVDHFPNTRLSDWAGALICDVINVICDCKSCLDNHH